MATEKYILVQMYSERTQIESEFLRNLNDYGLVKLEERENEVFMDELAVLAEAEHVDDVSDLMREAAVESISARLELPDVDLIIRSSGEHRLSNFLLWQSAYAEMVFLEEHWPDVDRRSLWRAVEIYASRDRRYGAATDTAQP